MDELVSLYDSASTHDKSKRKTAQQEKEETEREGKEIRALASEGLSNQQEPEYHRTKRPKASDQPYLDSLKELREQFRAREELQSELEEHRHNEIINYNRQIVSLHEREIELRQRELELKEREFNERCEERRTQNELLSLMAQMLSEKTRSGSSGGSIPPGSEV